MRKFLIISEGKSFSNSEPIIATGNRKVVNVALTALFEYLEPALFGAKTDKVPKEQPQQAPEDKGRG